nr:EOG090X07UV [Lepidurus arcticus]
MSDPKRIREGLKVVILCFLWYVISSTNNVVGKMVLNDFPYPMTVTIVQLFSITAYSGPLFRLWGIRRTFDIGWPYYFRLVLPLALGKFVSSVFSHVSIWKVPVSFAHTVKASMPLFTVVLSRVLMGEQQTAQIYLSLVPIITGVAIATITELSFDVIGLVAALLATAGFSLQNIFSKKVLHDTGVHHLRLLHILGRLSFFMFLPIWLLFDFPRILNDPASSDHNAGYILIMLAIDGFLNWLQNIVAFSVLSLVTPLTYAVANASKRIAVIVVSLLLLKNPVTLTNVFGMGLAVIGVLYYNKAKYDANQAKKKTGVLPISRLDILSSRPVETYWSESNGYALGLGKQLLNGKMQVL